MNLDDFDFTTLAKANTSRLGTIITITPISTRVKRKKIINVLLVIDAIDKNNKIIEDAIDHINTSQIEIENNKAKSYEKTFEQHFKYLNERNNKVYKMNKIW
jgi:FtsZ-binding cell division protein ZapB